MSGYGSGGYPGQGYGEDPRQRGGYDQGHGDPRYDGQEYGGYDPRGYHPRAHDQQGADGYRTQVSLEPVASEDGGTQNFVVATITRFFSSSMGPDQVKELGRQIARKYAGFGTYPSSDKPGVRWLPFASDGPTLKLFAPIGDVLRRGMALRHHPA